MKSKFAILSAAVLLLFLADIALGSVNFSVSEIFAAVPDSIAGRIIADYRLPKAITAIAVGVALSLSGVMMQTVFRNPLAGPYVLGVSAGASLGVALFLLGAPVIGVASNIGVAMSAWLGAAVILLVVLFVSVRLKDIMAVLILGMMLSSAAAAGVDVLQYFSSESALKGFVIWSMGSLGGVSVEQLTILLVAVVVGAAVALGSIKKLDMLLLGENYARSMGLNMTATRIVIFAATSILAGSVTAFCGPIAFVGIAVPHAARMIFRSASHRVLLPSSMLMGAAVMLACDIIAGVPGSQIVLPINTVTALFGIPIVILVVVKSRKSKIM